MTYLEHAGDAARVVSDDVEQQTTAVLDGRLERDVSRTPLTQLRVVVAHSRLAQRRHRHVFAPRRRAARAAQEHVAPARHRLAEVT